MKSSIRELTQQRIAGTIFGAACGGSLGGSCIGLSHKEILVSVGFSRLREFEPGLSRSYLPNHCRGALLADMLIALILSESLITHKGRLDEKDLTSRYRDLLEMPEFVDSGARAQCLAALRQTVNGSVLTCADQFEATHASGAARAFVAGCLPGDNLSDEPSLVAIRQAKLSYGDEAVSAAAAVIADSVKFFINGNKIDNEQQVRLYVEREFKLAEQISSRFAEAWDSVAPDLDYSSPAVELPYSLINVEPTVCELVPTAFGIFLIFRHSLEEAICAASRCGGDTDIVSMIVGALAGAYHGKSQIPMSWLDNIAAKPRLENVISGFNALWVAT